MKRIALPVFIILLVSWSLNAQVAMQKEEGGLLFLENGEKVLFYQAEPKSFEGKYERRHYIHPLWGVDGEVLTEDFPIDHLHHRGIFWAWHQILIDNKSVADGWELKNFQQKVTDIEFRLQKGIGYLNVTVDWISPLWMQGSAPYLQEKTAITIYPKSGNYRRFDFEIKLKALTDRFSIGGSDDEKGYSGFSIRLKLPADVGFTGENGLVEPTNAALVAGNSMKIGGSFLNEGKKGGVVILSNPQNPAPSDSWIIRKKASMQNAAYPGRKPVAIPVDQPLVLKYSLLVFQGEMNEKQIKKAVNQFNH